MTKPAIDIIGHDRCSGCFACYSACPENAITMQLNGCGFYVPLVDRKLCSECSICTFFCPVLTHHKGKVEPVSPKAFASWSLDEQTRMESSSGGIFSELAASILEEGGVVFACVWGEGMLPRHVLIDNMAGLQSARGAKYVQSRVGETYKQVLQLSKKKEVLFVGTPCQTAAMRRFCNKSNGNKILIADLVCHGTASIRVFHSYVQSLFGEEKVQQINFRDKANGWSKFRLTALSASGQIYSKEHRYDPFFSGYLQNLYLNHLCYACPFCTVPRTGDITLGDYWGVPKKFFDEKGVSVVLANTERGENALNKLKICQQINLIPIDFKHAANSNPRLVTGSISIPKVREYILNEITREHTFKILHKKYIRVPSRFRRFAGRVKRVPLKIMKYLFGMN